MANYELLADPEARSQHIYELVGILPDDRYGVPTSEINSYIHGVQAGDAYSQEKLIATRLNWIYTKFASMEAVEQRSDLELADVMQIGCWATLAVAKNIDFDLDTTPTEQLHLRIPKYMGRLMMEGKLIPTIRGSNNKPTYMVIPGISGIKQASLTYDEGLPEHLEPLSKTNIKLLEQIEQNDITVLPTSTENEISLAEDHTAGLDELIEGALALLNPYQRVIVKNYFGLNGEPYNMPTIAEMCGVTKQAISKNIQHSVLAIYYNADPDLKYALKSVLEDDQTNYGLVQSLV